jgi:tetratricopeptide (TPR) repeat protein
MPKKKNKIDTTLKRAEKLFKAGKFLLAEKEFEKVVKKLNNKKIDQKLEICRKETRIIKGRNLVEQGQLDENNDKLPEAIACFQEAEKLLKEHWLTDTIKDLHKRLAMHKIDAKALEAESSCDYLKAFDLYTKVWETTNNQEFLLKSALSLVKAENYVQAAAIFQKPDLQKTILLDEYIIYHYGFALAKTGKFYEALKLWEKLDTQDNDFIEQNRLVLSLACSDLYYTLEKKADINEALNKSKDLLSFANTLNYTELICRLEDICTYCKLVLIEALWQKEDFSSISDILLQMPVYKDSAVLALNAKTYFHLSGEQERFLEPMMAVWLTAIYSSEISTKFSDIPENRKRVQDQLIRFAEQQINCQQDSPGSHRAAKYLAIEKKLLKDLQAISQKQGQGFNQICTPQYASIFGFSNTILDLIKLNADYFKDQEHYLETGGYYSRAGEGLYALRTNGVKKALALVAPLESSISRDEFIDYVLGLVQFESGLAAMENNEKNYLQYFTLTPELFESVPAIEKRFSDKILQFGDDRMASHEEVLMFLHKKRRSDPIAEALSSAMTQSAIIKYNRGNMNDKLMKASIEKALKIYPDNEFALLTLKETSIDLETDIIFKTMSRGKMNKAARLASKSIYPKVVERYFEFGGQALEQISSSELDLDTNLQKIHLHDLLSNFMMVDPYHPSVDLIKEKLQFMEE